jgi:hypothetical protein
MGTRRVRRRRFAWQYSQLAAEMAPERSLVTDPLEQRFESHVQVWRKKFDTAPYEEEEKDAILAL